MVAAPITGVVMRSISCEWDLGVVPCTVLGWYSPCLLSNQWEGMPISHGCHPVNREALNDVKEELARGE